MERGRLPYHLYILLGSFYLVSKIALFIHEPGCVKAVLYGILATSLATCAGVLALREYDAARDGRAMGHLAAATVPLAGIPLTLVVMVNELGLGQWPSSRIAIFITWESLHVLQSLLVILMFRNLRARLSEVTEESA